MEVSEKESLGFLKDGGDMGVRIRSKDWSRSVVGPPEEWPQSLRTAISILLNSQFPMFVWWGPELITFYNDAYIPIAGKKHPAALGEPGPKVWAEIWDVVGPLAERVMTEGQSTWSEDQVLYMNRKGYLEETYFTFSYSPVFDEAGGVAGVFCACTETTEKVLAARRIEESERNLRNTILQAPVAMCILRGPQYEVAIANERMYELWGRGASEMLRRPIFEGLPEAREQGLEELLDSVYNNGESFSANERPVALPRNGHVETVYLNFVYEPFRDGDGTISGIIAVGTDVTEQVVARKRIEESEQNLQQKVAERTAELQAMNTELQRTNANLEEFAYAASHDLKEPIRKIHFFSDRIKDKLKDKLDSDDLRLFERMEHASQRMGLLVDDLLAYSQVTKGVSHLETIDLNEKIRNVLEDLELEIAEKAAVVTADPLPTIQGHKRQMQQVFQNLIGNALKYSKKDEPPRIAIHYRPLTAREAKAPIMLEDREKKYHYLEVVDNGIGFEQKDAERIFNVFTRLHGNAEYRGTGVGLSIVRKVMENHGGYIWAESQPGVGTTFKLLLPAA